MHLLLAEDDRPLSEALQRSLEEEGHIVDPVYRGDDAIAQAEVESYDVVILDLMLPGCDGFEVLHDLRAREDGTPVLILTARDAVSDRVRGLDGGADDYLVKPFALSELSARVRALGRRARAAKPGPEVLRVGDLELDLHAHRATRGTRTVDLTAKEFALLEALMQNPGRVLTRSQLLDRVWNYDVFTESNVVDIYIHYLRRKIEAGDEPRLLHTVRGSGYVIREP
jgi:DNA-binding response OmpR family regulator